MDIDESQPQPKPKRIRSPEEQAEINERMAKVRSRKAEIRRQLLQQASSTTQSQNVVPDGEQETHEHDRNPPSGDVDPVLPVAEPVPSGEIIIDHSDVPFSMDPAEVQHIAPIAVAPPSVHSDRRAPVIQNKAVVPSSMPLPVNDDIPRYQGNAASIVKSSLFSIRGILDYLKLLGRGTAVLAVICFVIKAYAHRYPEIQSLLQPDQSQSQSDQPSDSLVDNKNTYQDSSVIVSRSRRNEPVFLSSNATFNRR